MIFPASCMLFLQFRHLDFRLQTPDPRTMKMVFDLCSYAMRHALCYFQANPWSVFKASSAFAHNSSYVSASKYSNPNCAKKLDASCDDLVNNRFARIYETFLISLPSPLWWGKVRMGVDVLDHLPPPPESSPTAGGGDVFWLNWGSTPRYLLFLCTLTLFSPLRLMSEVFGLLSESKFTGGFSLFPFQSFALIFPIAKRIFRRFESLKSPKSLDNDSNNFSSNICIYPYMSHC